MDKSKLRPATPADLVTGNKIIVEDAAGAFLEGEVVLTLGASSYGEVEVKPQHSFRSGEKTFTFENEAHPFIGSDFEDGRHGYCGLKLWVQTEAQDDEAPEWSDEVFDRAQISKGDEIIRPATGTLTENKTEDALVEAIIAAVEKATAAWLDGKERPTGLALAAATAAAKAYRAERTGGKN